MTLHAEAIERKQKAPPLTVDGLLRRRASQRPGVTALCDPPNLAALGFGEPKTLSYRETDAAVDALASFFIELGLEPGDTVVAQLPNLAMAPLTLLGAWRAGLTVAAVPMLWRAEEIAKVCEEVAPKALIGVSSFVGEKRAETLCAVAASQLSVRFVLGFGRDLPDGVASLDAAIAAGQTGRERLMDSPPRLSPAMITFTARAGAPLVAVARREEELLAQGAMTVLSLSLDAGDVILNPYPLTGPVGLSLGLMAWLVGGGTLVQHTPFDYQPFVKQLLDSGATVTAMPPPILAELVKDGVLRQPSCRLRRLGAVWSMPELAASAPPPFYGATPLLFDVYPLGDLASLVLRRETRSGLTSLPIGRIDFEDDETTVFIETKLGRVRAGEADELLLRGPLVPRGKGLAGVRCGGLRLHRVARRGRARRQRPLADQARRRAVASWRLRRRRKRARPALSELPRVSRRRLFRAVGSHHRRAHFRGHRAETERADRARGAAPVSRRAAGGALQIPRPAAGGEADPARRRRPREARADFAAGLASRPPASRRRRS